MRKTIYRWYIRNNDFPLMTHLKVVFLVLDNGKTLPTHHLLGNFEGGSFFVSAAGLDCWLVEANSTSRATKTEKAKQIIRLPAAKF